MFNIPAIAELVAGRFYGKVDANLSDFADKDLSDELVAQTEIENVMQDLVDVETISDGKYDDLVDGIMKHDAIQTVIITAQAMIREFNADQAEYAKGQSHYYGVSNADFI